MVSVLPPIRRLTEQAGTAGLRRKGVPPYFFCCSWMSDNCDGSFQQKLFPRYAEQPFQFSAAQVGNLHRAASTGPFEPLTFKHLVSERGSQRTGEMVPMFAPIVKMCTAFF